MRRQVAAGSFDDFARANLRRLVALGFAVSANEHSAWDLAQEALIRLYTKWGKVDQPLAYARVTVVRLNIDGIRRRKREVIGKVPERTAETSPASSLDPRTRAALASLSPKERAALALHYLCDMSVDEVASAIGCSAGTVRSHMSRGRDKLRSDPDLAELRNDSHGNL